jgi:hypothetical protein
MNLDPEVFLKLPLGLNEKQRAKSKNLERGGKSNETKRKAFR